MTLAPDPIADLATALARDGGLKIWSVVVTVLGDIAFADRRGEISGPDLARSLGRIGIQPDALRVALHRLRQDGWTQSRKHGRTSLIRLSNSGLAETEAVTNRVFGPAPKRSGQWAIALAPPRVSDELASGLALGRGRYVVDLGANKLPADWLSCDLPSDSWPGWFADAVNNAACTGAFSDLASHLSALDKTAPGPDTFDRAALRVLILHGWRRLILRANPVAVALLGRNSDIAACRALVQGWLAELPHPPFGETAEKDRNRG